MTANRPNWFLNMCALTDWRDVQSHLAGLAYWSPFINRYLDTTHVKDNADALAVVRVCHRLFMRFADFRKLEDNPHNLKVTARRLAGLAGG